MGRRALQRSDAVLRSQSDPCLRRLQTSWAQLGGTEPRSGPSSSPQKDNARVVIEEDPMRRFGAAAALCAAARAAIVTIPVDGGPRPELRLEEGGDPCAAIRAFCRGAADAAGCAWELATAVQPRLHARRRRRSVRFERTGRVRRAPKSSRDGATEIRWRRRRSGGGRARLGVRRPTGRTRGGDSSSATVAPPRGRETCLRGTAKRRATTTTTRLRARARARARATSTRFGPPPRRLPRGVRGERRVSRRRRRVRRIRRALRFSRRGAREAGRKRARARAVAPPSRCSRGEGALLERSTTIWTNVRVRTDGRRALGGYPRRPELARYNRERASLAPEHRVLSRRVR